MGQQDAWCARQDDKTPGHGVCPRLLGTQGRAQEAEQQLTDLRAEVERLTRQKTTHANYQVWDCQIVVRRQELPLGFDAPPRQAAIAAIEARGFEVLECFSGWGAGLERGYWEIVLRNDAVLQPSGEGES